MFSLGKTPRLIWCGITQDLVGHIFWLSIGHSALNVATAVERVAMTGPFFLAQEEGPSSLKTCNSGLKLVQTLRLVPGWIILQVTFETLDRSVLPSLFLPAGLPLPAFLHFSFLLILQKSTGDAQGEFWGNSSSTRCLTAFALPNVSKVVAACTKRVLASLTSTVGILSNHVPQPPYLGDMLLW